MPDNINTAMINSVKETIKSSAIWNKLVKTIENANIDMDKLIQDSVEYGIEIGMFHQNKDGTIECKETKRTSNGQTNDKFISPLQHKVTRNDEIPQISTRSAPRSDSETTLSAYSSSQSIVTRTRKGNIEKELKRCSDVLSETDTKRLKSDSSSNGCANTKPLDQKPVKTTKIKPINRKLVRPIPICAFCLGDELLNKRTKKQENMITCWDCGTCAHPTCLQWPDSLFQKVRTIRWQCLQCKRCSYCGMISKKDDDMLLCDACDQGFHIYCCDPPIKTPPKGEWICRFCKPILTRKEKPSIFVPSDYDFEPDCQIITPETVRKICNLSPKVPNTIKSQKNNLKLKSKLPRKTAKVNLLQLKKKKLVNKAVLRQRQALTDGLSKFFTPSNKRQSRVSKLSISSDSFDKDSKKSLSIVSPKDKCSNRSIISSSRSKSPITVETMEESINSQDTLKSHHDRIKSPNKKVPEISVYHSPKSNNHDTSLKSQENIKSKLKKLKIKKIKKSVKLEDSDVSKNRGPGRPKKHGSNEKNGSNLDTSAASIIESSSVTMSKNDHSTNYSVLSAENCESDPYPISYIDRQWYTEIQQKVLELLPPPVDAAPQLQPLNKLITTCRGHNEHSEPPELSMETGNTVDADHLSHASNIDSNNNQRYPPRIQIGRYVIDTWYSAPYPSEYARLNVLYICEYCLKPIKSYDVYVMHMDKCTSYFPPGNEIYRNDNLSVFEVDGYVSKLYCQQLCLLAKLFLDHKTLYYDVEPFLFYVAVLSKNKSSHIIGYFSKEKRSTHKYNLSCIMVLPPYQKFNYGRFLIDFSYLLSRKEGQCGSPEKPLSTLGRISYESYWKSKILPFILNKEDVSIDFYARQKIYKPNKGLAVTIDRVSTETGISPHDVASTIQLLSKKVDLDNSDRISIQFDWEKLKSEAEKYAARYPKWIPIDEESLRWVPLINPNEKTIASLKSPSSVMNSPKDNLSSTEKDKSKSRKTTNACSPHLSVVESPPFTTEKPKSDQSKVSKKKRDIMENNKPPKSSSKSKTPTKSKVVVTADKKSASSIKSKTLKKKNIPMKREQIVTRHRSHIQSTPNSPNNEEISSIKVDLTKESSENSDIQDNDDCIEIAASIPQTRKNIWTNKRPVFEMFKDNVVPKLTSLSLLPPKESPPVNRNDPSPVSTAQNEIVGPILLSPEIDEENEEESDLGPIINDKRRLILILEKWDAKVDREEPQQNPDTIDLSDDFVVETEKSGIMQERNVFTAMEDRGDKAMEMVFAEENMQDNSSQNVANTIVLSNSEDSLESTSSVTFADVSKIQDFVLPASVKDSKIVEDNDKPPTLSRISSEEDNVSTHLEDSSSSFNLPTDFSQNEEFKNFFNDGNVFNSITTSQTDSSEKDADESLLSISNSNSYGMSDLELNGVYSCDSSICYNLRPRLRAPKINEEPFENPLRCSPGQSDLVQNHVSSTTPFVSPSISTAKSVGSNEVDLLKCEITFEDIDFVNSEMAVSDSQQDPAEKDCNSIDDNVNREEGKITELNKEIDTKTADFDKVNIDVVSSSLPETNIISDSSVSGTILPT